LKTEINTNLIAMMARVKKKKHPKGTRSYELHKHAKASLGRHANWNEIVKCPPDVLLNDWLATNVVDFYNKLAVFYGTFAMCCTDTSCKTMSAGEKYIYLWADEAHKKPVECSAPEYINNLMAWIEGQLDNPAIFPPTTDQPYPKDFHKYIANMFKRMFRVYAHVYYSHFADVVMKQGANTEAQLNNNYKHFYYFVSEFHLLTSKELEPLAEMTTKLTANDNFTTSKKMN